jgi:hypothetical protein
MVHQLKIKNAKLKINGEKKQRHPPVMMGLQRQQQ